MFKNFPVAPLVGAIVIACASTTTLAEQSNSQDIVKLDPIVVTASKIATKIGVVPARVTVISKDEIQKNPALNLSEIAQKDPSIYVKQSGGIGQPAELSLRGSAQTHTLVLKDGARLNNQNNFSPLWTGFLDTTNIDQIEIVKGPASVQYGSDAIGGVINMISAIPIQSNVVITGIYGENDTYKAIVNASLVDDSGFYAQVGGQRLESDGTTVLNTQEKSQKAPYDQKGYSAKLGYHQAQQVDASVEIEHNEGTSIFTNDYIFSNSPREFENQAINAKLAYYISPALKLSTRYSNTQDQQNVPAYASYYNTENNEADANLQWNFTASQNVLFGVNYLGAEYESNTITASTQDIDSIGYYIQHQYNANGISTQLGARVEDNERFGTHTVGQGAIRYHFNPATSIYANIGSAFRAPSLNELYSQWGGNIELEPEESLSYEIGLDHKIAQSVQTGISLYRTEVDNLIDSVCIADCSGFGVYQNQNIDQVTMEGGEVYAKWQGENLYANVDYSYVKSENKETDREIAYRPQHTGTLTLGYDDGVYGLSTSLIARSKANSNKSNDDNQVPGFATIDINVFWNINPNLKLFTNVQNIGDVRYKQVYNSIPFTSWYIDGGRQANVGVTVRY